MYSYHSHSRVSVVRVPENMSATSKKTVRSPKQKSNETWSFQLCKYCFSQNFRKR